MPTGGSSIHPASRAQWRPVPGAADLDGFEIKRMGDEPLTAKIIMQLKWLPPRFKLSQPLAQLLGLHTDTHATVLMALYKYIKVIDRRSPFSDRALGAKPIVA